MRPLAPRPGRRRAARAGGGHHGRRQVRAAHLARGLAGPAPQPAGARLLLVDYKGGTAFGRLVELPHVTGVVTDLDAANAHRVLSSLTAELRRREAALAGARGGADTDRRLLELGRLVVVVDEFRVLAEEAPDVLTALVRVATVGRGPGRPPGAGDPATRPGWSAARCAPTWHCGWPCGCATAPTPTTSSTHPTPPGSGPSWPGRAWVRDASGRAVRRPDRPSARRSRGRRRIDAGSDAVPTPNPAPRPAPSAPARGR